MSRRRNKTNQAGTAVGMNYYKQATKKKNPAGTNCQGSGKQKITLHPHYTWGDGGLQDEDKS